MHDNGTFGGKRQKAKHSSRFKSLLSQFPLLLTHTHTKHSRIPPGRPVSLVLDPRSPSRLAPLWPPSRARMLGHLTSACLRAGGLAGTPESQPTAQAPALPSVGTAAEGLG